MSVECSLIRSHRQRVSTNHTLREQHAGWTASLCESPVCCTLGHSLLIPAVYSGGCVPTLGPLEPTAQSPPPVARETHRYIGHSPSQRQHVHQSIAMHCGWWSYKLLPCSRYTLPLMDIDDSSTLRSMRPLYNKVLLITTGAPCSSRPIK